MTNAIGGLGCYPIRNGGKWGHGLGVMRIAPWQELCGQVVWTQWRVGCAVGWCVKPRWYLTQTMPHRNVVMWDRRKEWQLWGGQLLKGRWCV